MKTPFFLSFVQQINIEKRWKLISFTKQWTFILNVRVAKTLIVRHVRTQRNIQLNWNGRIFCMQQRCIVFVRCLWLATHNFNFINQLWAPDARQTENHNHQPNELKEENYRNSIHKYIKHILCYGMRAIHVMKHKENHKINQQTNEMQKKIKTMRMCLAFYWPQVYWSVLVCTGGV